jgi:dipeptidyl-peptidase-3
MYVCYIFTLLCSLLIATIQGSGDQKFVPPVSKEFLEALASVTPNASALCCSAILAPKPGSLGYTSLVAQSSYYPGEVAPTPDEISSIGRLLEQSSIAQENTRIRKRIVDSSGSFAFDVLQASVDISTQSHRLGTLGSEDVFLVKGDHSKDLARICDCLLEARSSAANETQKKFISEYVASFTTGSLELHKESQRTWVRDHKPAVETQFGFVEPYRDPFGTRAEFEGLVAVVDAEGTQVLTRLVETSERWIGTLPWVKSVKGPGRNGPFEKDLFNAPDFTAIHGIYLRTFLPAMYAF